MLNSREFRELLIADIALVRGVAEAFAPAALVEIELAAHGRCCWGIAFSRDGSTRTIPPVGDVGQVCDPLDNGLLVLPMSLVGAHRQFKYGRKNLVAMVIRECRRGEPGCRASVTF